jgi:archaemetzincin
LPDIYLWWIGADSSDEELLHHVQAQLRKAFGLPVRFWHGHERPNDAFDARRQQHSSTRILKWLVDTRPRQADKVLAITDVDLFIPILTFVYGEAQLSGMAAVVSTARLTPDLMVGSTRTLASRLAKESVHEVGHTFGLIHCSRADCVMARSVTIVHVDAKQSTLCQDCRSRFGELQRNRGSNEQGTDAHTGRR